MNYLKIFALILGSTLLIKLLVAQGGAVNYDHSKNPYYSHTETKPVKVSDAEWKKNIACRCLLYSPRARHRKGFYRQVLG